jgi:hypothetical protein
MTQEARFFPETPAALRDAGYMPGAPTPEIAQMDAECVKGEKCPDCGKPLRYEAWHKPGSYLAFTVCDCGYREEF